jgi:murein DD-endopeptidase MepM/ murein hydrolase activator NlpD
MARARIEKYAVAIAAAALLGSVLAAAAGKWTRPRGWPATPESARKPCKEYYDSGQVPRHDPADVPDLGLKWQLPVRADDLMGQELKDLGGAYCPTLKGREDGGWSHRYRGIHRGHDLGVSRNELGGRMIPVRVIADGVYDGMRIYSHAEDLPKYRKALVVYHFATDGSGGVYTSIYCHVDPELDLKAGQRLKGGEIIGTLEDPDGLWDAHVHLELYTRPVYSSKDSTKHSLCGCQSDSDCDAKTRTNKRIPKGCGIFEDDLYLMEPVLFITGRKQ